MVDVSTNFTNNRIGVSSTPKNNSVETTSNLAKYYEELAKEHEENAKQSEDNAQVWAEGTDEEVTPLGGVHSSKGWAETAETTVEDSIIRIQEQEDISIQSLVDKETEILGELDEATQEDIGLLGATLSNAQQTLDNDLSSGLTRIDNERDLSILAIQGQQTTTINEVKAEGTRQKAELQPYVDSASASATSANNSKERCEYILERLGTAIKIKGRVNSLDDLPKTGNLDGDAYLVGEEGLDSYPEYYWFQNHWEFLGTSGGGGTWGTITGDITAQTDLKTALENKTQVIIRSW